MQRPNRVCGFGVSVWLVRMSGLLVFSPALLGSPQVFFYRIFTSIVHLTRLWNIMLPILHEHNHTLYGLNALFYHRYTWIFVWSFFFARSV